MSVLIFQKMIKKYNTSYNKKTYTLNSENVAQNFVRLARHFLSAIFRFNEREIFSSQSHLPFPSCTFLEIYIKMKINLKLKFLFPNFFVVTQKVL